MKAITQDSCFRRLFSNVKRKKVSTCSRFFPLDSCFASATCERKGIENVYCSLYPTHKVLAYLLQFMRAKRGPRTSELSTKNRRRELRILISSTSPVSHRLHLAHLSSTSPSSLLASSLVPLLDWNNFHFVPFSRSAILRTDA